MTLELPAGVLAAIEAEAAHAGRSPEEVVADALRARFAPPTAAELHRRLGLPCRPDGTPIPPDELTHEQRMAIVRSIGQPIGANLTNEQLSREAMYD